ncbi:MAG TPA: FAD-dependent oxidoreductase [Ktedonobacterales bacterium]
MDQHMDQHYDLVVIGAGPAGESAAVLAATFGHRAVVVERDKPGGTVTTTGGAPTKTLREAALYLTGFRHRDLYGITVAAPPEVVLAELAARTRTVCLQLQQVVAQNLARNQVAYRPGVARLGPDRAVVVQTPEGEVATLTGEVVLIATGSRPLRPANIPFDDPDVCDSDQIFKLNRVTHHLFIIGAGAVGVEFATIFAALGAHVTLSDAADRMLAAMDGEIAHLMADQLTQAGVEVVLGASTRAIERVDGQLRVTLDNGAVYRPDAVLFAAGRRANTEGLGLEAAGVQVDPRGRIAVNAAYQTTAAGIYAAGDVVAPALASIAMEQGRLAMFRAFNLPFRQELHPLEVSAVYGVPEVAAVGLTEEACRDQGLAYEVGRCDLGATPRGAIAGHGGLLKLLFRRDDRRLLGVHALGDIASELVGMGQAAINSNEAIDIFAAMTLNTPTYTYAYKYAAFDGLLRLAAAHGGPSALATLAAGTP